MSKERERGLNSPVLNFFCLKTRSLVVGQSIEWIQLRRNASPFLVGEVSRLGHFRNSGTGRPGAVLIVIRERGDDNHRPWQEGRQGTLAGAALWSPEDSSRSRDIRLSD